MTRLNELIVKHYPEDSDRLLNLSLRDRLGELITLLDMQEPNHYDLMQDIVHCVIMKLEEKEDESA